MLLSVVDMEDESQHLAIIINDYVLIASNGLLVTTVDEDESFCIGGMLLTNVNDHEYNEIQYDGDVKN